MPDFPAQRLTLDDKLRLLLHSPRPFETWLRHHEGEFVGGTGAPGACPLAHFLRARLGLPVQQDGRVFSTYVCILHTWQLPCPDGDHRTIMQNLTSVALPYWARRFVCAIDASGKDKRGLRMVRPVPRDVALQQLAAVTLPDDAKEVSHA